ncbi:Maf family protein [Paenibacillus yanchengensis]|uniref:dTTP/UTP pyrophosphatase n=1 Tax=Paenibacillus yanchengensis TaxID=2035833 RepID=A0ABW4YLC2_9BACL
MLKLQNNQRIQQLWLASASPRREQLIKLLGLSVPIVCQPSEVDESYDDSWSAAQIVEQLSLRKGQAVARTLIEQPVKDELGAEFPLLVVGSDTIVVLEDKILGKPVDAADARSMLASLQGKSHYVYTGVAALYVTADDKHFLQQEFASNTVIPFGDIGQYRILSEGVDRSVKIITGHTASKVTFKSMSDEEIEAYIASGEPFDKAGSYGVQGLGAVFIEKIEGDFYSIMGLPINLLYKILLAKGISPFVEK